MTAPINISTSRRKILRWLLFLPPVVIILVVVWQLKHPGDAPAAVPAANTAFNKVFPRPNLDTGQKTKLELYLQAQKDSLRRKEQEAADPNKGLWQAAAGAGVTNMPLLPPANATPAGWTATNQLFQQKVNAMTRTWQRPSAGTLPMNMGEYASSPDEGSRKLQQLQALIADMHQPDTSGEAHLHELTQLLDKVYALQHPDQQPPSAHADSTAPSYPLATHPAEQGSGSHVSDQPDSRFYSYGVVPDSLSSAPATIQAMITTTQTVEDGGRAEMRLLQSLYIHDQLIPSGTIVYGRCAFAAGRVGISLSAVVHAGQAFPIQAEVVDAVDGLPGIPIQDAPSVDQSKQNMTQALQGIGLTNLTPSLGAQAASASLETAKNWLSRKVRTVRVTLQAGHRVLLRDVQQRQ